MTEINVQLSFWGVFRDNFTQDSIKLSSGSSLLDLIESLKQSDPHNILETKGIFALAVNGELVSDYQQQLADQDHVDVLPPVTGG